LENPDRDIDVVLHAILDPVAEHLERLIAD
jgi:hypothetical protein